MNQLLSRVNQSRSRCEALLFASSRLVRVPPSAPAGRTARPDADPRSRRASTKRA